jgi:tryptophan synthase alpha chain
MMDRYAKMFLALEDKQQGAFVPFVAIGDPDEQTSINIIQQLIDSGADALELGIPFSDPIADGPTIQKAALRALKSQITPDRCFKILSHIRQQNPDIPIGLLLYSNLVLIDGIDAFYEKSANAGVDSILIADVPTRESQPFIDVAEKYGIKQILIAPPNASEETLEAIGEQSAGYTYLLGRAGVTGAETAAEIPAKALIENLKKHDVAPPLLGFGISRPKQVAEAIKAGAAGAISGSATVKIIEQYLSQPETMLSELDKFVRSMKSATSK